MPRLSKIGAAALAAFGWTGLQTVSASYLVVAGGGGGAAEAGGGGAGGLLTGTSTLNPTLSYSVTVGSGGAAGTIGNNSVFNSITSTGGGGGGTGGTGTVGGNGGSGGGGGFDSNFSGAASRKSGGSAVSGQGNAGGYGEYNGAPLGGGGGGGAGGAGANYNVPANGGVGLSSSISGTSTFYAGGGGGGGRSITAGSGGNGGGGAGSVSTNGTPGTANTGGGGGGGATGGPVGGQGGSGIVIISYVGAQQFGGGVVTSSGGSTIHTFTTSGTLSPITPLTANALVVAGGGGGSRGGGGAGGYRTISGLTIDPNSTYAVTVGAGGVGDVTASIVGAVGGNSAFSSTTSTGGGGGGSDGANPSAGGSGGGAAVSAFPTGGAASPAGQGNAGGNGFGSSTTRGGGGGGGATAAGVAGTSATGGAGGAGTASSISGSSVTYAGGGGAWGVTTKGAGGAGGGGGATATIGVSGTVNTGGGGGGGGNSGGNGGSGVVIISYAGATQLMAGGTVTISGGNVIHTFTSTGYLAPLKYVSNSLRSRTSGSTYMSRTITSAPTSRTTMTMSMWVKRGILSNTTQWLFGTANNYEGARFWSDDTLYLSVPGGATWITSASYRDPAAWYHFTIVSDTTNGTAADRFRFYVNGVRQTFGTSPAITQNQQTTEWAVSGFLNTICNQGTASRYFDGYLAEVNFVDGQALTPSSFGTINSYGVWQPITYGGSYGTNGFYLPFTNTTSTTTLGYDFSPQGNNWTTNNISLTAGSTYDSMTDVPTLTSATAANYCVMNPLDNSGATISNGNLQVAANTGTFQTVRSSFVLSTGSWYVEVTATTGTGNGNSALGIALQSEVLSGISGASNFIGSSSTSWGYASNGNVYNNNSIITATGVTWAAAAVIGITFDGSTLTFYKNNVLVTTVSSIPAGDYCIASTFYSSDACAFNFGQRPFTYTAPSGFVALNTYNL